MDVYNAGVFSANAELDVKYVFVPLYNARKLLEKPDSVTAVELFLKDEDEMTDFQERWSEMLAQRGLKLVSRLEKNALIYKTTQSEKWATFAILFFILLIACFNIVASLSMMMIEKRQDMFVFQAMGANRELVKRIFILQGALINAIGASIGVALGLFICWLQITFGLVTMEGAVVESYPIAVDPISIFGIFLTVLTTGSLFCWLMVNLLWRSVSKADN
jgi:lipoprotein-releasing system permease protein